MFDQCRNVKKNINYIEIYIRVDNHIFAITNRFRILWFLTRKPCPTFVFQYSRHFTFKSGLEYLKINDDTSERRAITIVITDLTAGIETAVLWRWPSSSTHASMYACADSKTHSIPFFRHHESESRPEPTRFTDLMDHAYVSWRAKTSYYIYIYIRTRDMRSRKINLNRNCDRHIETSGNLIYASSSVPRAWYRII